MNVSEILAAAQKAVDEAGVADDLRPAAFDRAVELLTGQLTSAPPAETAVARGGQPAGTVVRPLEKVAAKLGLPNETIGEIFYENNGLVGVSVPSGRLDATKTGGTRQLALLFAVGQQAAEIEEWTSSSAIRQVCDEYGKFDSSNFAVTLAGMDELFQVRGRAQSREVRVKRPGYEAASALIRELMMRDGD